jgi:hypothetical protein
MFIAAIISLFAGIKAYILPAVSAEDCLFADLGIDPSYPGLQTLEATDMLLRRRMLLTDSHVIIWQVGCVGDVGFRRKEWKVSPSFGRGYGKRLETANPATPICEHGPPRYVSKQEVRKETNPRQEKQPGQLLPQN